MNFYYLFCFFYAVMACHVLAKEAAVENETVIYQQTFDWVMLTSDEWLKGEFISMYEETLEFDSDELGVVKLDWEDIVKFRSKTLLSIKMLNGTIAQGRIVLENGILTLLLDGKKNTFDPVYVLSIAPSEQNETDLWDGNVNIGANLRRGNSFQFDYTFAMGIQRRSTSSRFNSHYTANYSQYREQDSDDNIVTANSRRLTSTYDWFFSRQIFLRALDFEYFSDEFLNVDKRFSYSLGVGYHLIDNSSTTWDINGGPSYQNTLFHNVEEGKNKRETSLGLLLGTEFTYEFSDDIEYSITYQVQNVSEESGDYIHYVKTGLDIDLISDLDFNVTFYFDRIEKPKADSLGVTPKKNDYRLVFSLGYDF